MSEREPASIDHQRVLDLWRERLIEARKRYDLAVTEVRTAGQDFTAGTLPGSDGNTNILNTLQVESKALNDYLRTLRIFTDLVISGKVPEE